MNKIYIQTQVYSDTFKNPPYSIPQREYVYTTPVYRPTIPKEYYSKWEEQE